MLSEIQATWDILQYFCIPVADFSEMKVKLDFKKYQGNAVKFISNPLAIFVLLQWTQVAWSYWISNSVSNNQTKPAQKMLFLLFLQKAFCTLWFLEIKNKPAKKIIEHFFS